MTIKALEGELKQFILRNNPSVVDDKTRKMPVNEGGFGIPNVNLFWKAIRLSWLRRVIDSDSTWFKLHKQEVFPNAFDPHKSNFESLSKAKLSCRNPFWRDVYSSIIECRLNVLRDFLMNINSFPSTANPTSQAIGSQLGKSGLLTSV